MKNKILLGLILVIILVNSMFSVYADLNKEFKNNLKKALFDEEVRLFEFLIKQEKMHLASLKKAKEFLGNPEQEFHAMEKWLLDGGV